jgi:internalin A
MISLNYRTAIAKPLISLLPFSFLIGIIGIVLIANSKPIQAQEYNRFSQWCENKNMLSLEARHTIEVMLWHSRTTVCQKAETILLSRINLQLGNSAIVDLRPLSSMQNLRTLDLGNNQITDVRAIANLKNLTFLNLSHNRVVDVAPLANLSELAVLSLQGNQVKDVSSLRGLGKLENLKLGENPLIVKECPIAKRSNQSVCEF